MRSTKSIPPYTGCAAVVDKITSRVLISSMTQLTADDDALGL